jgi:hypothetical protein
MDSYEAMVASAGRRLPPTPLTFLRGVEEVYEMDRGDSPFERRREQVYRLNPDRAARPVEYQPVTRHVMGPVSCDAAGGDEQLIPFHGDDYGSDTVAWKALLAA